MTADELFLCTLEDLESRLSALRPVEHAGRAERYELLMVASLLRKLLLDGGSLVALVNRPRRVRLRFLVSTGWPFMSGGALAGCRVSIRRRLAQSAKIPTIPLDQLPPGLSEMFAERQLTLGQLLAEAVVTWNGVPITAKGLITYVANIDGGVHIGGRPTGPVEEALARFGDDLLVDGYPLAQACLWDIGGVVASGLGPLRAAVEAEPDFRDQASRCAGFR